MIKLLFVSLIFTRDMWIVFKTHWFTTQTHSFRCSGLMSKWMKYLLSRLTFSLEMLVISQAGAQQCKMHKIERRRGVVKRTHKPWSHFHWHSQLCNPYNYPASLSFSVLLWSQEVSVYTLLVVIRVHESKAPGDIELTLAKLFPRPLRLLLISLCGEKHCP